MTSAHAGIGHDAGREADRERLTIAFMLIVVFMAAEVATGVIANSLALLSDAGHMLTDAAALGFSLFAIALAARPARGAMTFGFKRAEILSAQANGITLVVLAAVIAYEAIRRLFDPPQVQAWPVLAVALAGVAVNLAATWTLAAERAGHAARGDMEGLLHERSGLDHTTLQVDHAGADLLAIEPARVAAGGARGARPPDAGAGGPDAAKANISNN